MELPKNLTSLYENARENYGKKEYDRALKQLNEALYIEPNYAEAMILLVLVHSFLDFTKISKEEALQIIERVLNLKSESSIIWSDIGRFYSRLKDYEKAIECFNKVIEIDPNDNFAYRSLAYLYTESGNDQKMLEIYQKLFKIDPDLLDSFTQGLPTLLGQKIGSLLNKRGSAFELLELLKWEFESSEIAYRRFRSIQSEIRESAEKFPNDVFTQKLSKLDLSNFNKIISEILEEIEDAKQKDRIINIFNELKMRIYSFIPWNMRHKIKDTTINLSVKYNRLQILEIAEKCGSPQDCVIVVIKEMIKNEEIYADYFESTQFVVFDQKTNLDETENIRNKFELWEKTTCKKCGMKVKETNQKICEYCGLDL